MAGLLLAAFALLWFAACDVDARINPSYGCRPGCEQCIRNFCYDPPDPEIDASVMDATVPDASPADSAVDSCDAGNDDGGGCGSCDCPDCGVDCKPTCGNGTTESGEQCDGEAYCSPRCVPLFHPSLAHRYTFDGKGTDVVDSVGAANGKLVNTQLNGSGDLVLAGGATDQYVDLPNALIRGLSSSVTIEVWVTWTGNSAGERLFDFGYNSSGADKHTGPGTSYIYATPQDADGTLAAHINFTPADNDSANDVVVHGSAALSRDVEHQVVVVFNGRTDAFQLYLDGMHIDTKTGVRGMLAQLDDRNVWIGRANAPGDSLKAILHDFRIYDEALNNVAIAESHAARSNPTGE